MTVANINVRDILLKRGNTVTSSAYVGPIGELVLDTDLMNIRIQDGNTAGGASTLVTSIDFANYGNTVANISTDFANLTVTVSNLEANVVAVESNVANLAANVANIGTSNPFNQPLNTTDNVYFNTIETYTIYSGNVDFGDSTRQTTAARHYTSSPPTTSKGRASDKNGYMAVDANYHYYCTSDGSVNYVDAYVATSDFSGNATSVTFSNYLPVDVTGWSFMEPYGATGNIVSSDGITITFDAPIPYSYGQWNLTNPILTDIWKRTSWGNTPW